jgi:hypothetical protein
MVTSLRLPEPAFSKADTVPHPIPLQLVCSKHLQQHFPRKYENIAGTDGQFWSC